MIRQQREPSRGQKRLLPTRLLWLTAAGRGRSPTKATSRRRLDFPLLPADCGFWKFRLLQQNDLCKTPQQNIRQLGP